MNEGAGSKARTGRPRAVSDSVMNRHTVVVGIVVLVAAVGVAVFLGAEDRPDAAWTPVAAGIEYRAFAVEATDDYGAGRLQVVRVDPARADLVLLTATQEGDRLRTAGRWCREFGLAATINAGMYQEDRRTNVGYMRHRDQQANPSWHKEYHSVLAFGPRKDGAPGAVMIDADAEGARKVLADYDAVVQNLRLIKAPGRKRLVPAGPALERGGDRDRPRGPRPLPLYAHVLDDVGVQPDAAGLAAGGRAGDARRGGPDASLSVCSGSMTVDANGGYETGLSDYDSESRQRPIPNVIGVRPRVTKPDR